MLTEYINKDQVIRDLTKIKTKFRKEVDKIIDKKGAKRTEWIGYEIAANEIEKLIDKIHDR